MICHFKLCDKCGVILTDTYSSICFTPNHLNENVCKMLSLCPECAKQFRSDYLNVRERLEKLKYPQERAAFISRREWIKPKENNDETP